MTSGIEAVSLTGSPPFEKVRSCWVRSRARKVAFSASERSEAIFSSGSTSKAARFRLPRIATRMLLKSWAIPPAKTPTDSSFFILMSSSSILSCSVTSLKTRTTPMILLSLSRIGAPLSAMLLSVPSFAIRTVWFSRPMILPVLRTFSAGLLHGLRVFSLTMLNTLHKASPKASFCDQPVRSSATLFMSATLPFVSVVITPSPMLLKVTASCSFSAARAFSTSIRSDISSLRFSFLSLSMSIFSLIESRMEIKLLARTPSSSERSISMVCSRLPVAISEVARVKREIVPVSLKMKSKRTKRIAAEIRDMMIIRVLLKTVASAYLSSSGTE